MDKYKKTALPPRGGGDTLGAGQRNPKKKPTDEASEEAGARAIVAEPPATTRRSEAKRCDAMRKECCESSK